jgi:hypothetical protein
MPQAQLAGLLWQQVSRSKDINEDSVICFICSGKHMGRSEIGVAYPLRIELGSGSEKECEQTEYMIKAHYRYEHEPKLP